MNIIKSSATSAALSLMLVVSSLSAQAVTGTNVMDIGNNAEGSEPFAGGARVTHTVNTAGVNNVRDFHVCVGETTIAANGERKVEGDPHNNNYRTGPNVPAGWAYRGVQRGVTENGKTTWCVTWVKTTPGGEAPNTQLSFEYDYRGPSRKLRENNNSVVFTSDGNNSVTDGMIGNRHDGVGPISMSEPSDEQRPASALWLALGALVVVLFVVFAFMRRANKRETNTTHDAR